MRKILSLFAAMLLAFVANAQTIPSTDFAGGYFFGADNATLDGYIELYSTTEPHYLRYNDHDPNGTATWQITATKACKVEVILNVTDNVAGPKNGGHIFEVKVLDAQAAEIGSLAETGESSAIGDIALAGEINIPAAGTYTVKLLNSRAWSKCGIKGVTLKAEVLPEVDFTTPYVCMPANAKLSGRVALHVDSLKWDNNSDATLNGVATWKLHITRACELSATINNAPTNTSGHCFSVQVLDAQDAPVGNALAQAANSWSHSDEALEGTIAIPAAGDYTIKLSNSTAWSGSIFAGLTLTAPAAPVEPLMKTIYCKAESWWTVDNAGVAVYTWNDGGTPKVAWPGERMTPVEGETNVWSFELDVNTYHMCIFTRVNGSGEIAYWDAKSVDLTIPTDDNDMFTMSATAVWGDPGVGGEWSKFEPTPAPEPATPVYSYVHTKYSSNSSYAEAYNVTVNEMEWSIMANLATDAATRFGGKSLTAVDKPMYTKQPMAAAIDSIVIRHLGCTSDKLKVNSIKVEVASDAAFATLLDTITVTPTIGKNDTNTVKIALTNAVVNSYYRITYNLTNSQNSNYAFQITQIDFYGTATPVPPAPQPKFYVTGDSALVTDGGAAGKQWNPAAIPSMNDTLVLNLKAGVDYVLKVTLNGTWEGENNVKGYNELSEKTPGLKDVGNDHNIGFKLAEAGEVKVIYTAAVPNNIFKLEGNFYVEPAPVEGCDWDNIEFLGGPAEYANQFKVCKVDAQWPNVVNIQQPGFAREMGIYMTFPSDLFDLSSFDTTKCDIQGAGIIFHLSAFTAKETEMSVVSNNNPIVFTVYNENGIVPATPKFYVTGDSALVADGGAAGKAWNPAAIPSMNDTLVLNLKAGVDYLLKVSVNGTWEGENNVKGYNELTEKAEGLKDVGNDHNIGFKLAEAGEVKVIYTAAVPNNIFKLEGNFYVEPAPIPDPLKAVSDSTTWDFSKLTANTASALYNTSKEGILLSATTTPSITDEIIYAKDTNLWTIGAGFDGEAIAFTGEYPIRKDKYCMNGVVRIKTTVSGMLKIKFSDTGTSASATAVKRYLVVNGDTTTYWTSRENNGTENPYPAQLNVIADSIPVPAGDITISGSSAICVYFVTFVPDEPSNVYTVAGSPATVFGANWDKDEMENDMVNMEDGTYKWEKTNLPLAAGKVEFKVIQNHAWSPSWPAQNYELNIEESGIYTITIIFTEATKEISAVATKTGEAVVIPVVKMHGNFTGSWADTKDFTLAADSLTASLKLNLEAKAYEFGMKFDGTWKANGANITRTENTACLATGDGNMHITADQAGEYTFTYTFATQTLEVAYPELIVLKNCLEVYSMAKNDVVDLNPVTVTYVNGANVYVKDEAGAMLIYMPKNHTANWKAGDELTGLVGTVDIFNGLYEIKPDTNQVKATIVAEGAAPAPEEMTFINDSLDINKYIVMRGISIEGRFAKDTASNINFNLGNQALVLRSNFKQAYTFEAGKKYDIIGAVSYYVPKNAQTGNIQVYFISAEESVARPTTAPAAPTAADDDVLAIYCGKYTNNLNYVLSGWGGGFEDLMIDSTRVGYRPSMTWECIIDPVATNDPHDVSGYKKLHFDIWVNAPAKVKFNAEDVVASVCKDGPVVDLVAGWNSFDYATAEWPTAYDFKTFKCFTISDFQTPEGASAEGNPMAFANVYFYEKEAQGFENIDASTKAVKVLHNGQIFILRGDKVYTITGQPVK